MPLAMSALRSAPTKNSVGLSTEAASVDDAPSTGMEPRSSSLMLPGSRRAPIDAALPAAPVTTALTTTRPLPPGVTLIPAESPAAGPGDTDHAYGVLVELQRADARRVVVRQVVPRPPEAERFLVEGVVVADHASGDRPDAVLLQPVRPVREHSIGHAVRRDQARIAGADDDEVALERPGLDRSTGEHGGFVAVVPPELLGRRRERHDLHVRRRQQQLAGVQRVERFVVPERLDEHAPVAVLEHRLRQDGVDVADEGS